MKTFWRKKPAVQQLPVDEAPAGIKELKGLIMVLDQHGKVVRLSQQCQALLSNPAPKEPGSLAGYLAVPCAELALPIEQWPDQLSLVLRSKQNSPLYMQGTLFADGAYWYLVLADNTELMTRINQGELRRQVIEFSVLQATRVRGSSPEKLHIVVEDWLEGLMLRLRLPLIGLLVRPAARWEVYSAASLPGAPALSVFIEDIQHYLEMEDLDPAQPLRLVMGSGRTPLVLLPYSEHDGLRLWLVLYDVSADQPSQALSDTVWRAVFTLFGAPVSSTLRYKDMQRSIERNSYVQKILASGWWEYYPTQCIVYMEPSLAATLGFELDDDNCVNFETAMQIIDPLDQLEYRDRLTAALEQERPLDMVLRIRSNGESIWYRMMGELTGQGGGQRLIGYAMNVNDIRQMETAVANAQARLEGLIDNAPALVYVLNCHDESFHLEFCSASIEPMLGWNRKQLETRSMGELVHPEDRDEYYRGLRTVLHTGSTSRRYRVRNSNNDYHWVLDEAKLLRDERGMPKEIVGLSLDITEATESAELVRKSEERYRVLVEDSPAIICRYLPDLTVVYANRQLLLALGLDPESKSQINLGDFLSPENREKAIRRYQHLTPDNPGGSLEILLQLSQNRHAWWVWSDRAMFDENGRISEIQGVGRDNTEVINTRQQLYQSAKMATLGEMATGLAHEINQPLTVMRMALANILKRLSGAGPIDSEYFLEKLRRIDNQVNRASKVVDHMRIFGRRSEIKGAIFDPVTAIQEAVLLVKEDMEEGSVDMQMNLEPTPLVRGHIDRLEQVLINLLLNAKYAALKNANSAQPWVVITCKADQHLIYISVEDSGGGIPSDLLDRIFEPFVTTKPVGKGTGLGLSVSYGIVAQMRGKLSAQNTSAGAKFTIVLPIDEAIGEQVKLPG